MKNQVINHILEIEGGYVDDPLDSGGETNFGITVEVARANGYAGPMRDLPRSLAFDIYERKYWHAVKADYMPDRIAAEIVDTGVNMGTRRAGKILQRCLNVLNDRGRLYKDIAADGIIGKGTLAALNSYLAVRDEGTLLKALNCLQGAYYIELAERREKDERYLRGWLTHRVKL